MERRKAGIADCGLLLCSFANLCVDCVNTLDRVNRECLRLRGAETGLCRRPAFVTSTGVFPYMPILRQKGDRIFPSPIMILRLLNPIVDKLRGFSNETILASFLCWASSRLSWMMERVDARISFLLRNAALIPCSLTGRPPTANSRCVEEGFLRSSG